MEENVLFNDTLNTFYLQLYGVIHMVKDHLDFEGGNSFRLAARVLLYASSHRQDNIKDRSDDPSHHEQTLLPRSYISLTFFYGATSHSLYLTN